MKQCKTKKQPQKKTNQKAKKTKKMQKNAKKIKKMQKNKKTKQNTKAKAKGTYKKQNFKFQSVFGCKSKYMTSCKQTFKLPAANKINMEQKLVPSILTMIMMWLKINGSNFLIVISQPKLHNNPGTKTTNNLRGPNLLSPNWNLQRFCWIKSLLGKGKGSSAGTSLLRDTFC